LFEKGTHLKKDFLVGLASALALLIVVLLVRTASVTSSQVAARPVTDLPVDSAAAADHLAGALRFRTVSLPGGAPAEPAEMLGLHRYLEQAFPRVHAALSREVVADYSLLYTWPGSDPALKPLLLVSHLDVAQVEAGAERRWTQPPFAGRVVGGWIWGRGALDGKLGAIGTLEAVDTLLAHGFKSRRTVILALGHDGEVGGWRGAAAIAELLRQRGIAPGMVLGEGGLVREGLTAGLQAPAALLGTAEEGRLRLELRVPAQGQGAAPRNSKEILAAALARLEQPMPAQLGGTTAETLAALAPEMTFGRRLVLSNLWLFKPLVLRRLAELPEGRERLSTTIATTVVEDGGPPGEARAEVTFRILPGDSVAAVQERVRRTLAGSGVSVSPYGDAPVEPSAQTSTTSPAFAILSRTVREVWPGVVVVPDLVPDSTDCKHYKAISDYLFRFLPIRLTGADLPRMRGVDERLAVSDLAGTVRFYAQLVRNINF
jgi:carboxypeptidase PM20D1